MDSMSARLPANLTVKKAAEFRKDYQKQYDNVHNTWEEETQKAVINSVGALAATIFLTTVAVVAMSVLFPPAVVITGAIFLATTGLIKSIMEAVRHGSRADRASEHLRKMPTNYQFVWAREQQASA